MRVNRYAWWRPGFQCLERLLETEFVVLGFGLFVVYAEKQRPDMKMRNMKKTMLKPASVVTQRLSIASSKSSDQVCGGFTKGYHNNTVWRAMTNEHLVDSHP